MSKLNLGIEFGSTRIKAVLIDEKYNIVGNSEYGWKSTILTAFGLTVWMKRGKV
jgi:activator of 2-hydroxyglutaryl-CoA dehydratase